MSDSTPPSETYQLLERALAGDGGAERTLFDRSRAALVRDASAHPLATRLAPLLSPEDLADETLLKALASDSIRRFEDQERGALRRLLRRILDTVIIDATRRAASAKRGANERAQSLTDTDAPPAGGTGPVTAAYIAELRALCFAELDEHEAEAWRLTIENGLSPTDIAARWGVTAASARGVLFRARRKLSALLDVSVR